MDVRSADPVDVNGACHCGAVRFKAHLPKGLASARRCTCSICRMRGAIAITASSDGFELLAGEDRVVTYRFNTGVAEHHFCTTCGIYTHHKRRSNPNEYGVNAACIDGVSPFDFEEVVVNDGNRHPSDDPQHRSFVAGRLRFEAAEGEER